MDTLRNVASKISTYERAILRHDSKKLTLSIPARRKSKSKRRVH